MTRWCFFSVILARPLFFSSLCSSSIANCLGVFSCTSRRQFFTTFFVCIQSTRYPAQVLRNTRKPNTALSHWESNQRSSLCDTLTWMEITRGGRLLATCKLWWRHRRHRKLTSVAVAVEIIVKLMCIVVLCSVPRLKNSKTPTIWKHKQRNKGNYARHKVSLHWQPFLFRFVFVLSNQERNKRNSELG